MVVEGRLRVDVLHSRLLLGCSRAVSLAVGQGTSKPCQMSTERTSGYVQEGSKSRRERTEARHGEKHRDENRRENERDERKRGEQEERRGPV